MENQYNVEHAREILLPCDVLGKYLLLNERGVWPAVERDPLLLPETDGLRWRPAREMQHLSSAPEVSDTPMLPNLFNARELAAFMLNGAGALVADFYGDWSDGPSQQSLNHIDPDSSARRAVIEAFTAYRRAIEKVGKWDADALTRRDAAHKVYWKSSNDKALLMAFEDAQTEWDAAYQAWLTAMVVCLLEKPQASTEATAMVFNAAAPELQTNSPPAPVMAESASEAPAWTVRKPQRYNGYTPPLHRLLAAAHLDGKPRPTARDVVEAWRNNAPAEVAKALPDGFDYYDAKGNTKHANLEAIRKAIDRLTSAR